MIPVIFFSEGFGFNQTKDKAMKTKEFYSKNLITISDCENPIIGLQLMKSNQIRHLPVIDSQTNEIVGIVSDRDLISEMNNSEFIIKDIMTRKLLAFDINEPLKRIVDEMIRNKVSSAFIKRDGYFCGIITTEDMLEILSTLLENEEDKKIINIEPYLKSKQFENTIA